MSFAVSKFDYVTRLVSHHDGVRLIPALVLVVHNRCVTH